MTGMETEHQKQLHALTQQIGDLCRQVNSRDVRIKMLEELLTISLENDCLKNTVDNGNTSG